MSYDRTARISEEIKKELSIIIKNDLKDPRLSELITVTGVNVTKDLRYAKAFISVMGDNDAKANSITALKSAAGFIRHEVGERVKLRYTPEFIFELDDSIEHGINIAKILNDISDANKE